MNWQKKAKEFELHGKAFPVVMEALQQAVDHAHKGCGSG